MKFPIVLVGIALIAGLLITNIVFLNTSEEAKKSEDFYRMKFEALQGDVDVLTYDLITSRDSVRILNVALDSCLHRPTLEPETPLYVR